MGFRFYKRVTLFPGVRVNLSGSGASLSVGVRGAHVTLGRRGVTRTLGIPGTGIFYTSRTGAQSGVHSAPPPDDVHPAGDGLILAVAIVVVGLVALGVWVLAGP